jgi:hypothetical protein
MNDQDERPISDADARHLRSTPVPPRDLETRTAKAIFGKSAVRPSFIAALAALTIVPVVIAFGLGRAMAPRAPNLSGAYLLLIESTDAPAMTPDEAAARVREYGAWARELREKHVLVSAEKLDEGGSVVLTSGTTAPLAAADDRIGGFFILRAVDMKNALSIARASPHVRLGGRIVVRRIASASER